MFDRLRLKLEQRLAKLSGAMVERPVAVPVSDPEVVEALRIKGNEHIAAGSLVEAETCFRSALAHAPNNTPLLICLGYVLKEQAQLAEARIVLRRAAHTTGEHAAVYEAYYLLGQISEQQEDWDDALRQYTAALEHKPDFVQACTDGLRMLIASKKKNDVAAFLEERIRQCPAEVEYRLVLGRYYVDVSNSHGVVDNFTAAIALGASLTDLNLPLGQAMLRLFREEESRPYLENAVVADPTLKPYIDTVRAGYFGQLGDEEKAISLLENVIAEVPDYVVAHSVLLMILSYSNLTDSHQSHIAAAQRFAKFVESGRQLVAPTNGGYHNTALPKTLRVGFVAGEFKHHPVLHFLLGTLENLDASRVRTVAFSNNVYDDSGTSILKNLFDEWVEIRDVTDAAVVELVRFHKIDVLIDLCGHTGDGRLAVFAHKPAPVQVTWLGYWGSTGLTTMDYIIADPVSIPHDSSEWFSETVYRLPFTRLCMTAPRAQNPIHAASLAYLRNGYITFGSFQRTSKLNVEVLVLWARVLQAVPLARLRIQTDTVNTEALRAKLTQRMRDAGLDLTRVDLMPKTTADLYLAAHSEVDIILDTFPFTGGTTTAQALWMAVPTVTLAGNNMLSSQGASMLSCVGLTDWIARDEDDYVRIACRFANDPEHLAQLRSELRDRALQSPLFDVKRFAQDFTNGLWDMYRERMHPT